MSSPPLRLPAPSPEAPSPWAAVDAALAAADAVDLDWLGELPPSSAWSLEPRSLRFVTALVRELQPRHVVEFGSGTSTRVLARACGELNPPASVTSLESDPMFAQVTRRGLGEQMAAPVDLLTLPIVLRHVNGRACPMYYVEPAALAGRHAPSVVIIDGPPDRLGGRAGTIFQAIEFVEPNALVLLDDAERAAERETLAFWQHSLGETIEVRNLPGFDSGLAAVVVRDPQPNRRGWWWVDEADRPDAVR